METEFTEQICSIWYFSWKTSHQTLLYFTCNFTSYQYHCDMSCIVFSWKGLSILSLLLAKKLNQKQIRSVWIHVNFPFFLDSNFKSSPVLLKLWQQFLFLEMNICAWWNCKLVTGECFLGTRFISSLTHDWDWLPQIQLAWLSLWLEWYQVIIFFSFTFWPFYFYVCVWVSKVMAFDARSNLGWPYEENDFNTKGGSILSWWCLSCSNFQNHSGETTAVFFFFCWC